MTRKLSLLMLALLTITFCPLTAQAQETQTQYLSGHDKDDAIPWDFFCTAGGHSGQWTTIPVPSNWELHGFGTFSYGNSRAVPITQVEGRYKRTFTVPAAWSARRVFLVFEGAMTDTQAQVNGQSAGETHQGGYYRFQYEVTKLLKFGQPNLLEATVDDESANASVNSAERRGDYWNYGGIYRPVYLQAVPAEFIERVAVDAKADGTFAMDVFGNGIAGADSVEAQVLDLTGHPVGQPFTQPISASAPTAHLQTQITAPRLWTAETPNLYQVEVRLKHGATVLHTIRQRFGFRTIELRVGDGFYVNGKRILLKGSCRHTFWPDSGRCTSEKISREDIRLMKDMNMNAVRMSHYPPDQHFLDACDDMGLYVLDELGGWQHAYDTPTGHRLVQEMVVRDVNHPSILFWDNGNEGGWNRALDDDFALWDPQKRLVMRPGYANFSGSAARGSSFRGVQDTHYPNYARLLELAAGTDVFLPTEFLHGLYDGGAGSGLADYWEPMRTSKVSGGGFIWAFLDEDVKRVDLDGRLDSHGNNAPDGILGPYREKEGSYYAVKEVWSPVVIHAPSLTPDFKGVLTVENRYDFTDLKQCRFHWELRKFKQPGETTSGFTVTAQGTALSTASIPPGASGTVNLALPSNWRQAEALAVRVDDPTGKELWNWVWPLPHAVDFRALPTRPGGPPVTASETADLIQVHSGDLTVAFAKATGLLASVERPGHPFSLLNGPRPAVGAATLTALEHHADGADYVVNATYTGGLSSVRWRIRRNGWVHVDYAYTLTGPQDFFGVSFDYPEANIKGMKWFGKGPYHVWKNRLAGGTTNVWENTYNDTITGDSVWQYPEFKGYYAGIGWVQIQTTEGAITAIPDTDSLFLQMLTPRFSKTTVANVTPHFPAASLSFLDAIPAMGSKFLAASVSGPSGQPAIANGEYHHSLDFFFGSLPR